MKRAAFQTEIAPVFSLSRTGRKRPEDEVRPCSRRRCDGAAYLPETERSHIGNGFPASGRHALPRRAEEDNALAMAKLSVMKTDDIYFPADVLVPRQMPDFKPPPDSPTSNPRTSSFSRGGCRFPRRPPLFLSCAGRHIYGRIPPRIRGRVGAWPEFLQVSCAFLLQKRDA